jgi:hypothetical protein
MQWLLPEGPDVRWWVRHLIETRRFA